MNRGDIHCLSTVKPQCISWNRSNAKECDLFNGSYNFLLHFHRFIRNAYVSNYIKISLITFSVSLYRKCKHVRKWDIGREKYSDERWRKATCIKVFLYLLKVDERSIVWKTLLLSYFIAWSKNIVTLKLFSLVMTNTAKTFDPERR